MIPSRFFVPCRLSVAIVTPFVISAVFAAATVWAQGQPPGPASLPKLSEAEQAQQLQERYRIKAEVRNLELAGKPDEAVAAVMNMLAIERRVLGELHEDVVGSLRWLARLQESREEWAAARKGARRKYSPSAGGSRNCSTGESSRALRLADPRSAGDADPAQRQRLREADRLSEHAFSLYGQGRYAEGIDAYCKAMGIHGELLGEDHPDAANSMNNLAALHKAMGDYAEAEPLYRQA